jgi:hypothetical protein
MIRRLNKRCHGDHQHVLIVGGQRGKKAQVWPLKLCHAVDGIFETLKEKQECFYFPTQEERTNSKCPGCRGRMNAKHPKHTRERGERGCLYPDVVTDPELGKVW